MKHLSPLDYQALLEGCPPRWVEQHLDVCALCQEEFAAELRAELSLLALGENISPRPASSLSANRQRLLPPSTQGWEEISSLRATTPGNGRIKSRYQGLVLHGLFAAASALLPWLSFLPETASRSPEVLQLTLDSRCLSTQPWCR
jgi:hypothetical protein